MRARAAGSRAPRRSRRAPPGRRRCRGARTGGSRARTRRRGRRRSSACRGSGRCAPNHRTRCRGRRPAWAAGIILESYAAEAHHGGSPHHDERAGAERWVALGRGCWRQWRWEVWAWEIGRSGCCSRHPPCWSSPAARAAAAVRPASGSDAPWTAPTPRAARRGVGGRHRARGRRRSRVVPRPDRGVLPAAVLRPARRRLGLGGRRRARRPRAA